MASSPRPTAPGSAATGSAEGPPLVLVAGATQYRGVDQTTPRLAGLLAEGGRTVLNYEWSTT